MKKPLFLICMMLATATLSAQQAAQQLAQRVLGEKAAQFEFAIKADTVDYFQLQQHGSKISITANNDNSLAMGLNCYLKEVANVHVSWYACHPTELPQRLPKVATPVTRKCGVPTRFFLNYCTYGYTMVWWKWREWEHFIDWMALNGINMPLALTGQEAVWQEVWREMGMTDQEIRSYFSGPAHLPWHRMANLDGFGGPLPQEWIDGQKELQKKILARERELNMTPVLPAFAGHVPAKIAERNPQADIKRLSSWCGFEPTYFMNSTDSLFAVIQRKYLEKQTALYGMSHIYGVDPFNEMDPPSWDPAYLAGVSKNIYTSLQQVDAEAKWLQMSWVFYYKRAQWTPERLKAYLTAVPQGKMILLDYFCEKTEVWRLSEAFYGQPFIWCYLGNFGGNTMLVGDIHELNNKMCRAYADQPGNMCGIGSTLEGFDNSPQIFEFLLEHPWNGSADSLRVADFARRWADMQYGKANKYARQAWQLLVDSVYKDWSFYGLGTQMVARPSLSGHGTYYTKPFYSYDNETLLKAIRLLMKQPSLRQSYQYDVANLLSQWMGNYFMEVRDAFSDAYRNGDVDGMMRYKSQALQIIINADQLLEADSSMNMWAWIQAARAMGKDADYYERQARTLLTIWGGPVLNDYGNRMWAGLLEGYYLRRWTLFFDAAIEAVRADKPFDEKTFDQQLKEYEESWTRKANIKRQGAATSILSVADRILGEVEKGFWDVPNRAEAALSDYMRRFPQAQLQDVYKTCFQDVYGPGHIIKDTATFMQYLDEELASMRKSKGYGLFPDYEYTGIEGNYVRVNLRLVDQGKVSKELLARLVIESAKQNKKMPHYDWKGQWMRILTICRRLTPQPKNLEEDASAIAEMLDKGGLAVHHSERFNDLYAPHYRLVRSDLFESELLPLLGEE